MSLLFGLLLLAAETASPATAATTAAPVAAPAANADKAEKSEKKICKREASTESRLGAKRVCLTAEQWKARQSES